MSYREEILASQPVAYWPFETANDIEYDLINNVPARRIGTVDVKQLSYPAPTGTDYSGAVNYYEVVPANMNDIYWNGGEYSAEGLCYSTYFNQDTIFSQRTSASSSDQGLSLFAGTNGPGQIVVDMGNSSTRKSMGGYVMPTAKYLHWVFTYQLPEKIGRLYVEGVLVGFASWVTNPAPSYAPPMFIGLLGGNSSYNWDGVLTQMSFYRRCLPADEVNRHHLASGALGVNLLENGQIMRRPVKRLNGTTVDYVAVRRSA